MIADLFLPSVATEVRYDDVDVVLPDAELKYIERAVPSRRAEFATGRACARACLRRFGHASAVIEQDERGAPVWPTGIVGTVTHCTGLRAAATAQAKTHISLGLDCEPDEPLPAGVAIEVCRPEEIALLRDPEFGISVDRLIFSAKEAVYKSWYPVTGRWLDFHDVRLDVKPDGRFVAHVLLDLSPEEAILRTIPGRWKADRGIIATSTEILLGATHGSR